MCYQKADTTEGGGIFYDGDQGPGVTPFYYIPIHEFISVNGVGYGRVSQVKENTGQLYPASPAFIRSPEFDIYPTLPPSVVADGKFFSTPTLIYVDPNYYDKNKFRSAILQFVQAQTADPGTYVALVRDCFNFCNGAINFALSESYIEPTTVGGICKKMFMDAINLDVPLLPRLTGTWSY